MPLNSLFSSIKLIDNYVIIYNTLPRRGSMPLRQALLNAHRQACSLTF